MAPIIINPNERLNCFKFLGTIKSSDLRLDKNTDAVVKRPQQRL